VFEGSVCALGLYIQSMNDIQAFFLRNICVLCVTRAVHRVEWCIAGSVSLEVASGSVSDGRKVVRVKRGYVSVQLRWIVRSQELGSVGTRVITVGFLDPPFWLHTYHFSILIKAWNTIGMYSTALNKLWDVVYKFWWMYNIIFVVC
jgi:hypothetical protein